jgi:glycosyltransferase involved in cell wall biosynthesis
LGKGAHYLLQAWRRLKPGMHAILDVYGSVAVPKRMLESCPANVVFHGSVPRTTLFAAYREADILVFPTLSDGFGMVVAEAFANGLPVVTTDRAGAADLVTKESGLVVPAADSLALVNALQWCLDDRDRLREMRLGALEAARGRQWSDFRRDLMSALEAGYTRAGYSACFSPV